MTTPLSGVFTAIVTPFDGDQHVDLVALKKLAERQVSEKIHGLVACGTTGEAPTLTLDEKLSVVRTCLEASAGKVPVIAGAGSSSTKQACELHVAMDTAGAFASLQVTPWYNKPTQKGLYAHFKAISEASPLPIILYNVPSRTGCNIEPKTVIDLATNCQNIIALKDSNVEPERIETILAGLQSSRPDFSLLSGEDSFLHGLLQKGGHGLVSVGANFAPQIFLNIYKAFKEDRDEDAAVFARQAQALSELMFSSSNPIPVKHALSYLGLIDPIFRLPLCQLDLPERDKLKLGLQNMGLLNA